MGAKVQIGHFFNGHKNEILFAYPRMFDDADSKKTEIHSKHEVSVKTIVGAQTFLISYSVRLFECGRKDKGIYANGFVCKHFYQIGDENSS